MGDFADQYIVLAFINNLDNSVKEDLPKEFKIVLVNKGQNGVKCESLPTLSFIPEVSHAKVSFTDVIIGMV